MFYFIAFVFVWEGECEGMVPELNGLWGNSGEEGDWCLCGQQRHNRSEVEKEERERKQNEGPWLILSALDSSPPHRTSWYAVGE